MQVIVECDIGIYRFVAGLICNKFKILLKLYKFGGPC